MKQARIFIDIVGTEGELDKAGQTYNIRTLEDCLKEAMGWAKSLNSKYPNMGWTYVYGDKELKDKVDIYKPLETTSHD